jgi:hypothetical protein
MNIISVMTNLPSPHLHKALLLQVKMDQCQVLCLNSCMFLNQTEFVLLVYYSPLSHVI